MKNKQTQKILIASLLVGTLQYIYNLFIMKTPILSSLFEGTFMFIFIGLLFMFHFKKDIFKNWIFFSIVLTLLHSFFMLIPLGWNWTYLLSLLITKFLMVTASIKFIDYIIED
ncbi:MAG: hypothetical protein AABY22_23345 [Nanoarchaeota archaeon]